jgi:hypothetical protein
VRLYFCEVEDVKPGQRRFQVQVQDQTVLPDFDIVAAAGAPRHGVVREIRGVQAGQKLSVALRSANGSARPPLLSGVELIAEGG